MEVAKARRGAGARRSDARVAARASVTARLLIGAGAVGDGSNERMAASSARMVVFLAIFHCAGEHRKRSPAGSARFGRDTLRAGDRRAPNTGDSDFDLTHNPRERG